MTHEDAIRYSGIRRIVRHVDTGELIGVAIEASTACGRADRLLLHGDPRQPLCFGSRTGKITGVPWIATPATDEEVGAALVELAIRSSPRPSPPVPSSAPRRSV